MEDVGVTTRKGEHNSRTDAEDMAKVTEGSGETSEVRVMGPAATMDIVAGTGVNAGAKVIHTNLTTPRTYIYRSAVHRPTVMEVGWYK